MDLKSERIEIGKGIHLNLIKTNKFKSNLLSYYFLRPLSKEEVTKNALLPLVLKRGTEDYDSNLKIQKKLEEEYGASFSLAINKRGEKHILRFTMEMVDGSYVEDKDYIYQVLDLLKSIMFNPILDKGYFKKDYVDQEKENLKRRIDGRINDKRSYALDRCIEEMCKNEKFSIYSLGYREDLPHIDEESLYSHYRELIETSPIEIFYVGNYDENIVENLKRYGGMERKEVISLAREEIVSTVQTKNMVYENLDISQGKLVLGFRTGIKYEDKLYNGLLVASDILGGGPNSKLFRNVRERESLAYYIVSTILKYKSLMLIDGGIEFDNLDRTIDLIKEEIEAMKEGNFTEEDMDISKRSIISSTESIKDSPFLISEFFFSQVLSDDKRSLDEIYKAINQVSKEDIREAISKLGLDTIYFMRGLSTEEV